jgi:hypothetical protein
MDAVTVSFETLRLHRLSAAHCRSDSEPLSPRIHAAVSLNASIERRQFAMKAAEICAL